VHIFRNGLSLLSFKCSNDTLFFACKQNFSFEFGYVITELVFYAVE